MRKIICLSFLFSLFLSPGCISTRTACKTGVSLKPHDGMVAKDHVSGSLLTIAPPEFHEINITVPVPADFDDNVPAGYSWPGARGFMPRYDDEDGSIILGGAFRQTVPETLEITSTNGAKLYIEGRDYRLNKEWGEFAAIDARLGAEPVQVRVSLAMQRIDLVQRTPDGALAVKKGVSRLVSPRRPAPDEGCVAVAGIYVAPWRRGGVWTLTQEDILPILPKPKDTLKPLPEKPVAKTRAKLAAGEPVRIAFIGDSITLGAEAGKWWDDDSTTYRGRVMRGLRARFPAAEITEIQAFQGGRGIEYAVENFDLNVAAKKPDLIIIGMGINDAAERYPGTGIPAVAPDKFKTHYTQLLGKCKDAGAEVIILTSMQTNPFAANGDAARWAQYRKIMTDAARKHKFGVADTYRAWELQTLDGTPPFSQLHNWINHPGADGHKIFADEIMRFFQSR